MALNVSLKCFTWGVLKRNGIQKYEAEHDKTFMCQFTKYSI